MIVTGKRESDQELARRRALEEEILRMEAAIEAQRKQKHQNQRQPRLSSKLVESKLNGSSNHSRSSFHSKSTDSIHSHSSSDSSVHSRPSTPRSQSRSQSQSTEAALRLQEEIRQMEAAIVQAQKTKKPAPSHNPTSVPAPSRTLSSPPTKRPTWTLEPFELIFIT